MEELYEKELRASKAFAKPGVHSFVLVLDHLKSSPNIGKIFRSAETFGVHEIHIVGTPFFDCVPAKGTVRKVPFFHYDTLTESLQRLRERGYHLFALDLKGSKTPRETQLPDKSAFIFGHEEFGIQWNEQESLVESQKVEFLKIKQYGETQSLNVSIAASLVMYEYVTQKNQR